MHEKILQEQLTREREVIRTMQSRQRRLLTPIGDFFWRKPWRSTVPFPSLRDYGIGLWAQEAVQWMRNVHDCSDPSIGCSCHPSFRFPDPPKETLCAALKLRT